jgi:predicted GNAT family N-acyltransferase
MHNPIAGWVRRLPAEEPRRRPCNSLPMLAVELYASSPDQLVLLQTSTLVCPAAPPEGVSSAAPLLHPGPPGALPSRSLVVAAAFAIRHEVFVEEQQVPLDEEQDAFDAEATHVLACAEGLALATARLVCKSPVLGKVGRVAVRRPWRGTGLGKQLMEAITLQASILGLTELMLDAQVQVVSFYERLGYRAEGERFLDAGIWHVRMRRALDPRAASTSALATALSAEA